MIGIYLMGFVILVAGLGVFGTAVAYAIRPTEQKLVLMRPLTLAAIFAAICSSSVGIAWPQYWHVFRSRSKMLCRVNFTSFFGIRSYMKSRMIFGTRMRKEIAWMESS